MVGEQQSIYVNMEVRITRIMVGEDVFYMVR